MPVSRGGGRLRIAWESFVANIIPALDAVKSLGSSSKRWAAVYAVLAVVTSVVIGSVYISSGGLGIININGSLTVNGSITSDGNLTADHLFADISEATGANLAVNWSNVAYENESNSWSASQNFSGYMVIADNFTGDLICTNCLATTQIQDIYVLNTGDTVQGPLVINGTLTVLDGTVNVTANASTYWGDYLVASDLDQLILVHWDNISGEPTALSEFTDDLGDRDYTHLSNFTDDIINGSDRTLGTVNATYLLIADTWTGNTTLFGTTNSARPCLMNEVSTATNPVFLPACADDDTGVGRGGTDSLKLIAGGVTAINITEVNNNISTTFYGLIYGNASQFTGLLDGAILAEVFNAVDNSTFVKLPRQFNTTADMFNAVDNSTFVKIPDDKNTNCSVANTCSAIVYEDELNKTYVDAQDVAANTSIKNYCDANFFLPVTDNLDMSENNITNVSDIQVNNNIYLGFNDSDQYIYFYDLGSPTGDYIKWNDFLSYFDFSTSISTQGYVTASSYLKSSADIFTTGVGDDLWLGTTTQANADFRAYANGDLIMNGTLTIGDAGGQKNITMFSPNGSSYNCGVADGGTFSCT